MLTFLVQALSRRYDLGEEFVRRYACRCDQAQLRANLVADRACHCGEGIVERNGDVTLVKVRPGIDHRKTPLTTTSVQEIISRRQKSGMIPNIKE